MSNLLHLVTFQSFAFIDYSIDGAEVGWGDLANQSAISARCHAQLVPELPVHMALVIKACLNCYLW